MKPEQTEDHNLRSRHQQTKNSPLSQVQVIAKRNRLSRKRLSVEEKLIEDNKSYYRVEVLNSKLRSTEYFINQKQLEARVNEGVVNGNCTPNSAAVAASREHQQPSAENKEEKEPVVVRFRKVRKSQLAVLSDEAESFMFGEPTKKESRKDENLSDSELSDKDTASSSSADEVTPKKQVKKQENISIGAIPCVISKGTDSLLLSSTRLKWVILK